MTVTFEPADAQRDRDLLLDLNIQYVQWLELSVRRDFDLELTDMLGGSIPDYVASALDKLCAAHPPRAFSTSSGATGSWLAWAACGAWPTALPK